MDLPFIERLEPARQETLEAWCEGDAWLAGGTWLFSEPQPQLRRLHDLHAFGWPALTVSDAGLEIAATCRLADLAAFAPPPRWEAGHIIRSCCETLLGSFKIWNEATVGGNICLALPAGPMTSLAASLDGICELWHRDGSVESVAATDFVTGVGSTLLGPGSLLRSVTLPARAMHARAAFRQVSRTPLGRSAAVVIGTSDTEAMTVTITAAVERPLQLRFAEPPSKDELAFAIEAANPPYYDDHHGSPPWRAQLTRLLAEQVRAELAEVAAR